MHTCQPCRNCPHGSSPRVWGTCLVKQDAQPNPVGSSPRVWGTCHPAQPCAAYDAVHPHVCGEHCVTVCPTTWVVGSSPRVWGTCRLSLYRETLPRFIPTCVGNIRSGQSLRAANTVHPHVCGEHVHLRALPSRLLRFIPTCVGNICRSVFSARQVGRFIPTCVGNMSGVIFVRPPAGGSSPRVWGTCVWFSTLDAAQRFIPTCVGNMRSTRHSGRRVTRFIPTCVGNIVTAAPVAKFQTVHPHVCGEHTCRRLPLFAQLGSSPRVWGTCRRAGKTSRVRRFIPTCVGNMNTAAVITMAMGGSSPRVWGTYTHILSPIDRHRFIPTCVGNMAAVLAGLLLAAVHPHVCGEHALFQKLRVHKLGSSPRVWGTFIRPEVTRFGGRFIPTCVGNMNA